MLNAIVVIYVCTLALKPTIFIRFKAFRVATLFRLGSDPCARGQDPGEGRGGGGARGGEGGAGRTLVRRITSMGRAMKRVGSVESSGPQ